MFDLSYDMLFTEINAAVAVTVTVNCIHRGP